MLERLSSLIPPPFTGAFSTYSLATTLSELRRLSTWLKGRGVEKAVTESKAQYWRLVAPVLCTQLSEFSRSVRGPVEYARPPAEARRALRRRHRSRR